MVDMGINLAKKAVKMNIEDVSQQLRDLKPEQVDSVLEQRSQDLSDLLAKAQMHADTLSRLRGEKHDFKKFFEIISSQMGSRTQSSGESLFRINQVLKIAPSDRKILYLWLVDQLEKTLRKALVDFDDDLDGLKNTSEIYEGSGPEETLKVGTLVSTTSSPQDLVNSGKKVVTELIKVDHELHEFERYLFG